MIFPRIELRNFRGHRQAVLELKPLTIVVGPNSAGKSSFAHSLVALQQADRAKLRLPTLARPEGFSAASWPVDLGHIDDLRTDGETGPVEIRLSVAAVDGGVGKIELAFGGETAPDLELSGLRTSLPTTVVSSVVLESSDQMTLEVGPTVQVVSTGEPQPLLEIPGAPVAAEWDFRRLTSSDWQDERATAFGRHREGKLYFEGWPKISFTPYQMEPSATAPINELNSGVLYRFSHGLKTLRYVAPNRRDPWRERPAHKAPADDVGADGRWFADVLRARGELRLDLAEPPPVPGSTEEALEASRLGWITHSHSVREWLDIWAGRLGVAHHVESLGLGDKVGLKSAIRPGQRLRDLPDIGFGVSQVLPVLVQGLVLDPDALFVVEQPESQLHPRPQAALADFFCALAKSGRQLLVESHSEALFHRLRLRVALEPELEELIAVYFVDQPGEDGCSEPRLVALTDMEALTWPAGFLAEGVEEELAIRFAWAARAKRTAR